jgi:superfamily I DNA/RNA helicase
MDMISYDRLSDEQRSHVELRTGHRIFHGVPGSGKTTMVLHRAARAAGQGKSCLVLCRSPQLANFVGKAVRDASNIDVQTFGQWAVRQGVRARPTETEDKRGQRLLVQLRAKEGERGQYGHVFIDEGQDFQMSWFACARLALKDPDAGDLWIMLDMNQRGRRRPPPQWASVGINAVGRRSVYFRQNYRNTLQIALLAETFAHEAFDAPSHDGDVVGLSFDRDDLPRRGPWPFVNVVSDARVEQSIKGLVDGSQTQFVLEGALHPAAQTVAILYARASNDRGRIPLISRLRDRYSDSERVTVSTIDRFKGREADLVVLLRADDLSAPDFDHDRYDVRGLLYTAITRARTSLVVLTGRQTDLTREIADRVSTLRGGVEESAAPLAVLSMA